MINDDYLYTSIYSEYTDFYPESESTYIYGYSSIEDRSHCADKFAKTFHNNVDFVRIDSIADDIIQSVSDKAVYNLRSSENMIKLFETHQSNTLYIDITGLDFRVCASLINNAIKAIKRTKIENVKIVYVEPGLYKIGQFRSEGVFHDLSEKINGIKPLPGFASIIPDDIDKVLFVALLGFEGGRFMHLLENLQIPRDNIIPIIGMPGYRIEYPFIAYWGNRRPLKETDTWRQIKYAGANSIVDIFNILNKISAQHSNYKIKVAPLGTMPHAIGAILFAVKHSHKVELIYDNPKRTRQRTEGVGKLIEYSVSKLLEEK